MHQRQNTQLDEFQYIDEQLELKAVDALATTKEAHTKVEENITEHLTN